VRFDEAGHQAGGANGDEQGRVAAGAERQAMGPLVCGAVLYFSTDLALRVTRLGLAVVGICCRSPPGL